MKHLIIMSTILVSFQSKAKKRRFEANNTSLECNVHSTNLKFNDLHDRISKYYYKDMMCSLENFICNSLKNEKQVPKDEFQCKIEKYERTKKRYLELLQKIESFKEGTSLEKFDYKDLVIDKKYLNFTNDDNLKVLWVNQECRKVDFELVLLMDVSRNIFCDIYHKTIISSLQNLEDPIRTAAQDYDVNIRADDLKLYGLLGDVLKISCKSHTQKIIIENSAISKTLLSIKRLQNFENFSVLNHLPEFFYRKVVLPGVFQNNMLLTSAYKKIITTNNKMRGSSLVELCLCEKQFLFIIFPSFILLQKELQNIWIVSKKKTIQIIDIFLKLDILIKITKYVYCQNHPNSYKDVIRFCIDSGIYTPIVNLVEILLSAILSYDKRVYNHQNYHLSLISITEKRLGIIRNDINTSYSDSINHDLINSSINSLLIRELNPGEVECETTVNDNTSYIFYTPEYAYGISYITNTPGNYTTVAYEMKTALKDKNTTHCHYSNSIEDFRKLWFNINPCKSLSKCFIAFEQLTQNVTTHSESTNRNTAELYTFFIIALFNNTPDTDFNLMSNGLSNNINSIINTLKGEEIMLNFNLKLMHNYLRSCISWFGVYFEYLSVEEEPYEIFIDALEFIDNLIHNINEDTNCLEVCKYIQNISQFQYTFYELFMTCYQNESVNFILKPKK